MKIFVCHQNDGFPTPRFNHREIQFKDMRSCFVAQNKKTLLWEFYGCNGKESFFERVENDWRDLRFNTLEEVKQYLFAALL